MKRQISALFFAGHFCADARTRLRKKGEASSILQGKVACAKLARVAGACGSMGVVLKGGIVRVPFIILWAPFS